MRGALAIVPHLLEHSAFKSEDVPRCGVIPCRNFTRLVSPFVYLSSKPAVNYQLFREVYSRYLVWLHAVSSLPNSIIHNCYLFEELLKYKDKRLVLHFGGMGFEPLKSAFPWLFYCFTGYLYVAEVFELLDRVLGFKSTQILVVVAVGIFCLKRNSLLRCDSAAEVEAELEDLDRVTVRLALESYFQE